MVLSELQRKIATFTDFQNKITFAQKSQHKKISEVFEKTSLVQSYSRAKLQQFGDEKFSKSELSGESARPIGK